MSRHTILIPKEKSIQASENKVEWRFDTNPTVKAERAGFYLDVYPPTGERSWVFWGITGASDDENYFSYLMSVPYINDAPIDKTFKLKDGLYFTHTYSSPAPPGFSGFTVVDADDADDAELTIKLDPAKGVVTGSFSADFKSYGYYPQPEGTFKLIRDDQQKPR